MPPCRSLDECFGTTAEPKYSWVLPPPEVTISHDLVRPAASSSSLAGLDAAVHLREARSDRAVERRLAEVRIESVALSRYASTNRLRPGLLLGFAAFDEAAIEQAVRRMAPLLSDRG